MTDSVKRVYVEKKPGFDVEGQHLMNDLVNNLNIDSVTKVKIINRYDVSNISDDLFNKSICSVFSESNQDFAYIGEIELGEFAFGVEYLPGQYDQRADSAAQCVQILSSGDRPLIKYAKIIDLYGELDLDDLAKIKNYYINPVDSREASLEMPISLEEIYPEAPDIHIIGCFIHLSEEEIELLRLEKGYAMSSKDLLFCQDYFRNIENRNPTVTELKVIDTYWSDHCRHTTFLTKFNQVGFDEGNVAEEVQKSYHDYLDIRNIVYENRTKPQCFMDIAVLGMKYLKRMGKLDDLEESDENNACSIETEAIIDGIEEKWLIMFKNETHNHPTEIEPFGGAATCLGGAIRDPLSGRSYVYQAMRITGSGDPSLSIDNTLAGKLPQRKITTEAAHGYSSYGNQIGLATGKVEEIYHSGYIAKRMEIGAVIAATPKDNVIRGKPVNGDLIILVGGRTGRDGCGGATGSSKEHDEESILLCGSEVQKGNAPEERKIQRLFRNKELSKLIKKCNDFGAGGISVAIGELADSLEIDLDKVPKKYEGLDGTELAISESQERMAVVLSPDDVDRFVSMAEVENLETAVVAKVTDNGRLIMKWRGKNIVDISRAFLDTNGVMEECNILVKQPVEYDYYRIYGIEKIESPDLRQRWIENLHDLNVAVQKGLVERFDSTIGSGTVLMPFGGKHQMTPTEGMVSKIPLTTGETNTCTIMAHGFDPYLSTWSPYHGAQFAVIHSLAKIVAIGGDYRKARLTLQEYFEKLNDDEEKWGKPFSALLGAFKAQIQLGIPAIGGKDSMSGTFKDLHVPPTLVSFAVCVGRSENIISPEFKQAGSKVGLIRPKKNHIQLPDYDDLKEKFNMIADLIEQGVVISANTIGFGGLSAALSKMSFGNKIGFKSNPDYIIDEAFFQPDYGSIVIEMPMDQKVDHLPITIIGETIIEPYLLVGGIHLGIDEMLQQWMESLNGVFPIKEDIVSLASAFRYTKGNRISRINRIARPRVFIPVFPGTNCEYDTAKAFQKAGGFVDTYVFRNLNTNAIDESIRQMARRIGEAQIIALPGGFSAGDEPEGSGKFITSVFKNSLIQHEVMNLIKNRDGLILGICNGFQALIKLGLLQYGEIRDLEDTAPTLTYNSIGRHISTFVNTKISSNLSPWFNNCHVGDIYSIPVSHGEGRFVANDHWISRLQENGQIAAQYVDLNGNVSCDGFYNPNGSTEAVEAITSPDGRILGKMGHSERIGSHLYKNIPGEKNQGIFEAGIKYYL
ncbi:MAG: Phosphoribosylformylglycinamidine synthase [Clostridiales bacterium 38_11]|nr:MAG: Phosphoribosylformylglycinamidine synthase [Clostridiales bacterium 38_11]HBH12766.1 phosphoribosylformylglycinamidine synthase [Clostridiales bacterium]